jgi:RNA polymerase sigma-70 factor (ECF subfamily)
MKNNSSTMAATSTINEHLQFAALFDTYYPRLCLYAVKTLSDKSQSEDLVQDCFVRIWKRRSIVPLFAIGAAYLYTSVRHAIHNHQRNYSRRLAAVQDILPGIPADPATVLITSETFSLIHQAVQSLPPKCQQVFQLLFIEGRDTSAAAEQLQCSESTIRTQKAKGLTLIRQRLQHFLFSFLLF